MFTLAISCLTTSSTLIHGPNIPSSYAILFFTASDFTSITCHIHSWAGFGSISSFFLQLFLTLLQEHNGHLPTWGVHLSVSYLFVFHTVHGVLKARILKRFAISFSNGTHFVRILYHDLSILVALDSMAHTLLS